MRGAWVEIRTHYLAISLRFCRSPCGERGLKCAIKREISAGRDGRSPCGERGLKYDLDVIVAGVARVAPRAGSVG